MTKVYVISAIRVFHSDKSLSRLILAYREREAVLKVVNSAEFCHQAPGQIVPALADKGYVCTKNTKEKESREQIKRRWGTCTSAIVNG